MILICAVICLLSEHCTSARQTYPYSYLSYGNTSYTKREPNQSQTDLPIPRPNTTLHRPIRCVPRKLIADYRKPIPRPREECYEEGDIGTGPLAPAMSPGTPSESMYINLLRDFAIRGMSRTVTPPTSSKTFYADYCIPTIGKDTVYVSFNEQHMKFVSILQTILLQDNSSYHEQIDRAYELLNYPDMNVEALYDAVVGVALSDTTLSTFEHLDRWKVIPTKFFNSQIVEKLTESVFIDRRGHETCVKWDETNKGRSLVDEDRLWYFREDPFVNSNHGIWHSVNPGRVGPLERADRRGELFYYFHRHLLARYNAERLSNGLDLVKSFPLVQNQIVREGYNPNLRVSYTGANYYSRRKPGASFRDVSFGDLHISVADLIQKRKDILNAIHRASIITEKRRLIPLTAANGIDYLGDTIEPGRFQHSHMKLYGNLHGSGHMIFASINNRTGLQRTPGAMGDLDTAMRDPVFYRWHAMIDDLLSLWKSKLPPYARTVGLHPLQWNRIRIANLSVHSFGERVPNLLKTFWNERQYQLLGGAIPICGKHLDHKKFDYEFGIESNLPHPVNATIRIFMAPRYDKQGRQFKMIDQHKLFFVLDTFSRTIPGRHRHSPSVLLVRRASTATPLTSESRNSNEHATRSCGCGWPHHLLLPKGTRDGMTYDMFIMITPGSFPHHFVEENGVRICEKSKTKKQCRSAPLLCGFTGKKYPDLYPMGYPFDRPPSPQLRNRFLQDYVQGIPNMKIQQVTIKHDDQRLDRPPSTKQQYSHHQHPRTTTINAPTQ